MQQQRTKKKQYIFFLHILATFLFHILAKPSQFYEKKTLPLVLRVKKRSGQYETDSNVPSDGYSRPAIDNKLATGEPYCYH